MNYRIKDITGQTFGRITVMTLTAKQTGRKEAIWLCQCVCGNTKLVAGKDLRRGHTRSCGCLRGHGDVAASVELKREKKQSKRLAIIDLVNAGKTAIQVCNELDVSDRTVRTHARMAGCQITRPPAENKWPDEMKGRLTILWNEGMPTAEIGRRIGVTKSAVIGKAHRIGLPPRDPIFINTRVLTDAEISEVRALHASGVSIKGISSRLHTHRSKIVSVVGPGGMRKPRVARPKVIKSPRQISLFETVARKPLPSCLVPVVRPDPVNRLFRKPTPGVRECQWLDGDRGAWIPCSEPASHGSWCDAHYKLVCVAA